MMASMNVEAEMENLFAEDEAEEEGEQGTQSLSQEEGMSVCFNCNMLDLVKIMLNRLNKYMYVLMYSHLNNKYAESTFYS